MYLLSDYMRSIAIVEEDVVQPPIVEQPVAVQSPVVQESVSEFDFAPQEQEKEN